MQKIKDIHAFLLEIFMIRESCKAEFVKQIFPHMGFAQGNNILRSFDLSYFHQKVMTKFLKTSETKFIKTLRHKVYRNSEKLHFGPFLFEPGQKKNFFWKMYFYRCFQFLGFYRCLKFQ